MAYNVRGFQTLPNLKPNSLFFTHRRPRPRLGWAMWARMLHDSTYLTGFMSYLFQSFLLFPTAPRKLEPCCSTTYGRDFQLRLSRQYRFHNFVITFLIISFYVILLLIHHLVLLRPHILLKLLLNHLYPHKAPQDYNGQ